jgi:outer membrane protein TolC
LGSSYSDIPDRGFVDFLVGLQFSQAIGNKAAEAVYRQARLRRSSSLVRYQRSIQQTVLAVKNALRDVRSNALLIGQNRALRLAQAENLRALLVDERTKGALTPEFLSLKFQRQDDLASAQVREAQALVDYNTAIARLFSAMGIGLKMNRIELRIEDGSRSLESASSVSQWREQP